MNSASSSKNQEEFGSRSVDEVQPLTMLDVMWMIQKLMRSLKDLLKMVIRSDGSKLLRNVAGYLAWLIVMTWLAGHYTGTVVRKRLCQLPFVRHRTYCSR